jgi:hypothetical protein
MIRRFCTQLHGSGCSESFSVAEIVPGVGFKGIVHVFRVAISAAAICFLGSETAMAKI